jgi:hypothetical protein
VVVGLDFFIDVITSNNAPHLLKIRRERLHLRGNICGCPWQLRTDEIIIADYCSSAK